MILDKLICIPGTLEWQCSEKSCYALIDERKSYSEAVETCERHSSSLVKIESPNENNFVKNVCGNHSCWLGLQEPEYSEQWFWNDGSNLEYYNWHSGEPNNYLGADETVAFMNLDMGHMKCFDGTWYDGHPSAGFVYPLCELDALDKGNSYFSTDY